MNNTEIINSAKNTLKIEAEALKKAINSVDNSFAEAVNLIASTSGKLIITGVGKSGLIGAKMAATFASTGTPSFFIHPTEALHGDLGMMGELDVVIAISYSGESGELNYILPHIKRFNIPLIGMTKDKNSTLGKYSDVLIAVKIDKEACPLGIAPTTSTTLTLALGDALAIALMQKSNFAKEDFANFHPGGSLGRQLFIKVSDLMSCEDLPIINKDTKLSEAIHIMSQGRLGNVLIVDKNQKLLAVMSDGDLRRALMNKDFNLNHTALLYANTNPKIIDNKSMLASEALIVVENYKIQLLIIVNQDKQVEGVLHLHQLIEAGIK